jgi:putative DNA primase/helicase
MSPASQDDFDPYEDPLSGPQLMTRAANTVTPSKPVWIIDGWTLRGAVNLVTGRQGAGKTTFAAYVVACVTTSQTFPGDEPKEPMNAAVLSLEEPDDRVVARLRAAGADLERVYLFGDVEDVDDEGRRYRRRWQLPKDIGVLGERVTELKIDVVIVDGIGYSIAGDSHNYSVVGSALAALAGEAERTDTAIVGLVHPPKGASDPVTAAIGSTAWTAIPRVCIVLGVDPEDDSKRVARVAKTNYREPETGISFTIAGDDEYECGFVANIKTSNITAEQITSAPATAEDRTERSDARDFLRDHLLDGPIASEDVAKLAEKAGVSRRTLFRARKDLGVISTRRTDPATGRMIGWTLELPALNATVPTTVPLPESGHSGHSGHIQELHLSVSPECQATESGTLDSSFYDRDEF